MTIKSMTILALAVSATLPAQTANPLSTELKASYTRIKTNFIKAAEKMPEEDYSFKPTPEVQTFAERVAHIADSNIGVCASLKGEKKSVDAKSKTAKADLVAALKASFAECDAVVDSLTDADAMTMITGRGSSRSKLAMLYGIVGHDNELYGYICVYMRLKGVLPPSSEH
jgi:uncharacterized damage-inducible protein DinB